MPPVVAAAAIGGAASIAGGVIGSKQANKAAKANQQAQSEALAYEREKDAQRKAEYDKAVDIYKQRQATWMTNRAAILNRYGVHLPAQTPMAGPTAAPNMGAGTVPPPSPVTLGTIAGATPMMGGPAPSPQMPQGPAQAPQDAFDWQNWSHYAPIR